jgi:hypothetical protein
VRTDTSDEPTPVAVAPGDGGRPVAGSSPTGDGPADEPGVDPTADEDRPGAPVGGRGPALPRWLVAAAAAAGVVVRLAILFSPLGRPDSDEVIAGLMTRSLGAEGFPTFFWGQQYGGTIELLPVAASLRVFGWSVGAMRVPTLVLAVVNALLIWRIGRRWLPERQAQLAGLVVWLGPPAAVWFGVREQLFYAPTVTLGLVLGLAAYRIRATGRARDYLIAGVALGLGVWTSTNIAYFVLPAAFVAIGGRPVRERGRELLVGVPVALAGLAAGAYLFIEAYLETDGAPMRIAEKFPVTGTYATRLGYFLVEGLPGALGLRTIFTHEWIGGVLGIAAYLAVLGLLGWSLRRSVPGDGTTPVGWAAVGLVVYPFVYAQIPFVMEDPNLRYTSFVVPFVALVLVRVIRSDRAAAIALALTLAVTTVGLVRLHTISELEDHGHRVGNVGTLVPVIDVLDREGIDAVYGDYWVAYRLVFETDGRVIAATSSGVPRYPPYVDHVRGSARSAWVVDDGDQLDQLLRALDAIDVSSEVIEAGDFAVVVPDRHVGPMEVPEEARRPM